MTDKNALTSSFMQAVTNRRSTYTLSDECTLTDAELKDLVSTTLEQAPSTFGSYTSRIVVLLHDEHKKFWDITTEILKAATTPDQFEQTSKKMDGFRGAYGTMLFLEDPENTRALQQKFPRYAGHFPSWSTQTSAIHQYILWTAITAAGNGANLQHYNPIVDEKTKLTWDLPADWDLVAQLVFGKPTAPPGPKPTQMKAPLEKRMFVHGATD